MPAFEAYLKGRQAKQTEEIRGAQLTGMVEARNTREAQARKQEQFIGMLGQQVSPEYQPLVQTGGLQGFEAAKGFMAQDVAAKQADTEAATNTLGQSLPAAIRITDNEEWQQFLDWSAPIAEQAGMDQTTFNRITTMPMGEAQASIAQMMDVEMPKAADERLPVGRFKNLILPDGTQKSYDVGDPVQGKAYQAAIEAGAKPQPTRQVVGGPGEMDKLTLSDTSKATIKVSDIIDEANKVDLLHGKALDLLDKNPDINTWAADVVRLGSDFVAGANALVGLASDKGVIDAFGDTLSKVEINDMFKAADGDLVKMNIESAELRSVIVNLAYRQAKANDKGGRVTEPDFKYALQQIGASIGDPAAFRAVLSNSREMNRAFTEGSIQSYRELIGEGKLPKTSWESEVGQDNAVLDALATQFPEGGPNKFHEGIEYEHVDGAWRKK